MGCDEHEIDRIPRLGTILESLVKDFSAQTRCSGICRIVAEANVAFPGQPVADEFPTALIRQTGRFGVDPPPNAFGIYHT